MQIGFVRVRSLLHHSPGGILTVDDTTCDARAKVQSRNQFILLRIRSPSFPFTFRCPMMSHWTLGLCVFRNWIIANINPNRNTNWTYKTLECSPTSIRNEFWTVGLSLSLLLCCPARMHFAKWFQFYIFLVSMKEFNRQSRSKAFSLNSLLVRHAPICFVW